ncbi:hypothetical protein [Naasia sp. SYSU D00057]|uniref:hypothetical protein n=1 Tax=Naasia sp. SYSU D00057 TaxID=2817380 RepID=UPI001B3078E2|nr:hypothetical protein [Naasia sp. SYSU D00057]
MGGWDGDAPRAPERRIPRGVLPWAVLTALVPLVFAVVVLVLNASYYSAGGFVSRYLDSLERRDLAVALATPGVRLPEGVSDAALTRETMGTLSGARIVEDRVGDDGLHRVTAEYRLGSESARTEFLVESGSPIALLFSGWRFAESPTAVLRVRVLHDTGFRIDGEPVSAADGTPAAETVLDLAVLAPVRLVLDQDTAYLTAEPVTAAVTEAGSTVEANVDVQANRRFNRAVQDEVNEFLDACAEQTVLQPAGCPFRRLIEDRVLDAPEWSVTAYPQIGIQPGLAPDGTFAWSVPPTPGTAHIRVRVVSLFDGSVYTVDEDVPFDVSFVLTMRGDGGLDIRGT